MSVKPVEYRLSFYEPDSVRECIDFDASTPFQAVHVGDDIMGITWRGSAYPTLPKREMIPAATVVRVVRSVATINDVIHDITLVYSKSLPLDA